MLLFKRRFEDAFSLEVFSEEGLHPVPWYELSVTAVVKVRVRGSGDYEQLFVPWVEVPSFGSNTWITAIIAGFMAKQNGCHL